MIDRKPYLREIRALGFRFARQQKRTMLYRKSNGTDYLSIPRTGPFDEIYVREALLQAGMERESVERFIETHSDENHS